MEKARVTMDRHSRDVCVIVLVERGENEREKSVTEGGRRGGKRNDLCTHAGARID